MAIAARKPAPLGTITKAGVSGSLIDGNKLAGLAAQLKEAKMTVTTTMLENATAKGQPIAAEDREVKIFVTSPANVGVNVSYTRNLGNFESVRVGVDIHMPCYVEEIDNAYAQVLDKAKIKLEEAIAELSIEPSETVGAIDTVATTVEETTTAEEDTVSPEWLIAATHEQLLEVCSKLEGDQAVNAEDYADDDDLRQVLIQTIFGEEALQAAVANQEATGEASEAESSLYTEEELEKGTVDELKQIFEAWEMGPFPKGPEKIARKAAIKKILEKQSAAS